MNRKPASRLLRKGRFSAQNHIYLITTSNYQRETILGIWPCASLVARALYTSSHSSTLRYVVMPDHYHWLMQLTRNLSLSELMHNINSFTANRINRELKRTGTVWQGGFHDHAVRDDMEIRNIARYVVANPLRAGLVDSISDYPFWNAVWL